MLINYLFFLEFLKLTIPKLRITLLSYIYVNLLIKYTVLVKKGSLQHMKLSWTRKHLIVGLSLSSHVKDFAVAFLTENAENFKK